MWDMCGTIQRSGLFRAASSAQVKTLALGRTVTVCKTAGSGQLRYGSITGGREPGRRGVA